MLRVTCSWDLRGQRMVSSLSIPRLTLREAEDMERFVSWTLQQDNPEVEIEYDAV